MSSDRLQTHLNEVETLLDTMGALLVRGDAPAFELTATALRQAMLELAHATALEPSPTSLDAATRARLQSVSRLLVRQRDNLARRSVVAERALATVLPHPSVTYSRPGRAALFHGPTARLYTTPAI